MDANKLPSSVTINRQETDNGGIITVEFGKNGWGLTDEFGKINDIIHELSHSYNVYLDKCDVDIIDDTYTFVFSYTNEHFND